ncbi:MAG: L,D-transpeptidase [Patescibacteria group bacterium]
MIDSYQGTIFQPVPESQQRPATPTVDPDHLLPEHASADLPQPEVEAAGHNNSLRVIAVIGIILFFGISFIGYYSLGIQTKAQATSFIVESRQQSKVLSEASGSGFIHQDALVQLDTIEETVSKPRSQLFVWEMMDARRQAEDLHTNITSQHSNQVQKEREALHNELSKLEEQMKLAESIEYPAKREYEKFVVTVESDLMNEETSLIEVQQYREEATKRQQTFHQELERALLACNSQLEQDLALAVNFDVENREAFQQQVEYVKQQGNSMTTLQMIPEQHRCQEKLQLLSQIVEQAKRDLVLATVTAHLSEAETLISFFEARSGYGDEVQKLNSFKESAATFIQSSSSGASSNTMQQVAQDTLYPTIESARVVKQQVEERERQERIEEQKRIAAESGVPVPPIDAPKVIVINVSAQRLYAYENGISIFDRPVPVTTGKAGYDTVRGQFSIYLKTTNFRMRSPFPDVWYDNHVDYWMPFYQGYGLHDASWRSVYGTMDYPSVGSHGCVNVPHLYISQLYNWAELGTPVVVQ